MQNSKFADFNNMPYMACVLLLILVGVSMPRCRCHIAVALRFLSEWQTRRILTFSLQFFLVSDTSLFHFKLFKYLKYPILNSMWAVLISLQNLFTNLFLIEIDGLLLNIKSHLLIYHQNQFIFHIIKIKTNLVTKY